MEPGVTDTINRKNFVKDFLPYEIVDLKITGMIEDANLTREKNGFFTLSKKVKLRSLEPALQIAHNWREFTKHFVFTVNAGIGVLSEKISQFESPPENFLHVLQTSFTIISDDLVNANPVLGKVAPKGPAGIHYKWWESTILNPLKNLDTKNNILPQIITTEQTRQLLSIMTKLSKVTFGCAVQLRIVEAIALDISLAFRSIYSHLVIDGKTIFPNNEDLNWMNAHIKAEVIHHRQATDIESGLVRIASTAEEQQHFLALIEEYIECWVNFFKTLENFLKMEEMRA